MFSRGLTLTMSRLLLAHDASIQELEAVTYTMMLLPAECTCMLAGKEAGLNYNKKVRSLSAAQLKEADLAPPHIYVYLATAENLVESQKTALDLGELSDVEQAARKDIEESIAQIKEAGNNEAVSIIPYFRVNTCHDKRWRVRMHCPLARLTQSLSLCLQREGGEVKKGKAPRGALVRELQKALDRSK
jgi:hypothetical protein